MLSVENVGSGGPGGSFQDVLAAVFGGYIRFGPAIATLAHQVPNKSLTSPNKSLTSP